MKKRLLFACFSSVMALSSCSLRFGVNYSFAINSAKSGESFSLSSISNSKERSSSKGKSSKNVCEADYVHPDDFIAYASRGSNIYTWIDDCGERRFNIQDTNPTDQDFFLAQPNGMKYHGTDFTLSFSLEEMRNYLDSTAKDRPDNYYVMYEIPAHLDEQTYLEMQEHPLSFHAKDEEIYDRLGISDSYEFLYSLGYASFPKSSELGLDKITKKADLEEYDTLFFGGYALLNAGDSIHLYSVSEGSVSTHEILPFRFFPEDPDDYETLSVNAGRPFFDFVKDYGMPSYAIDDLTVDYNVGNSGLWAVRCHLRKENNILYIDSFETLNAMRAIIDEGPKRIVDDMVIADGYSHCSLNRLIRKYGRPTHIKDETLFGRFGYALDNGESVDFALAPIGCEFDHGYSGQLIYDFRRVYPD